MLHYICIILLVGLVWEATSLSFTEPGSVLHGLWEKTTSTRVARAPDRSLVSPLECRLPSGLA